MIQAQRLRSAIDYVEWLRVQVHERPVPATLRNRAAVSCLAIAQEHHHAIIVLIQHQIYASAYALIRVAFEAYVRGVWFSNCASDVAAEEYFNGVEPPHISILMSQLEKCPAFDEGVLTRIKSEKWRAMCDFTHSGGVHAQRWNKGESIEPNYDTAENAQVLSFAETIGSLSVIGVAQIVQDDALGARVLEKLKGRPS